MGNSPKNSFLSSTLCYWTLFLTLDNPTTLKRNHEVRQIYFWTPKIFSKRRKKCIGSFRQIRDNFSNIPRLVIRVIFVYSIDRVANIMKSPNCQILKTLENCRNMFCFQREIYVVSQAWVSLLPYLESWFKRLSFTFQFFFFKICFGT